MLKSYFTIALRGLIRNKVFSFINILGLSVGLTAFILIMLYVRFEFSYDDFHKASRNIYRVVTKVTLQNEVINHESSTYDGIIKSLKQDFGEVKALTVISAFNSDGTFLRYEDPEKNIVPLEKFKGIYADSSFFSVFSFPLISGSPGTVLKEPFSAVVSQTLAARYFNNDALGKILEFKDDDNQPRRLKITGIVKDVPHNSHIKFDVLINLPEDYTNFFNGKAGFWDWRGHAYMLLNDYAVPGEIENNLDKLAKANNALKINRDDYGQVSTFKLQPLDDIHLFSQLEYEFEPGGQGTLVYSLLSLAGIILIIAWVNYINLSTAISAQRLREIGIRKVVGASKSALMFQVLAESSLFNFLSLVIAVVIAWILMPFFSNLPGVTVDFISLMDRNVCIAMVCFLILGTLLSGGYPALVISSLYPIGALKGKNGGKNPVFRKGLVTFQFTAAIVLMVITVVAYRQLSFMQSRELGINIDQVLVIKALNFDKETWSDEAGGYVVDSVYHERAALFKNELRKHSNIVNASAVAFVPGEVPVWGTEFKAEDIDPEKAVSMKAIGIDYDFIPTFRVALIAGRNFSPEFPSDQGNERKRAILVNDAAAKLLGFKTPEEAIARHITTYWGADYEIIGVVNSFHQRSLKENLTPLYFILQPRALSYFAVNFKTEDIAGTIEKVKTSWSRHFPDYPFNYFFLDEYFGRQYQNERKFSEVASLFTGLAVFIGCMGLFGLTAYAIVQRTKEIGIRKVLGASVSNVIVLFTADFIKLILIANAIAIPLVYFGITWWLDNYAYKIPLAWWLFAAPVVVILGIALVTVSLQTIKVARRNPVESLKYE
jgi:putative ABC transport system permease protein